MPASPDKLSFKQTNGTAAYFPGGTLRCGGLSLTDQLLVFKLK